MQHFIILFIMLNGIFAFPLLEIGDLVPLLVASFGMFPEVRVQQSTAHLEPITVVVLFEVEEYVYLIYRALRQKKKRLFMILVTDFEKFFFSQPFQIATPSPPKQPLTPDSVSDKHNKMSALSRV